MPSLQYIWPLRALKATALVAVLALLGGCVSGPATSTREDQKPALKEQLEGLSAEEIIKAGDGAYQRGEVDRALFMYQQAIEIEEDANTWFKIAKIYIYLGNQTAGLQSFAAVLQLDPDNGPAYEELGLLYVSVKKIGIAKQYFQRALELDETLWRSNNALGVLADTERDYAAAIGYFEAALAQYPDSAMLLNNLGYSYYLAGDLNDAEHYIRIAMGTDPGFKPARANFGLIHARRGNYDRAVEILRKIMERRQAYNDVGYIAYNNDDLDEAAWLVAEAIRVSPSYYQTAYENLEKIQKALDKQETLVSDERLDGKRGDFSLREGRAAEYRRVEVENLNVRQSGATDSEVVGYLRSGDRVEVLFDNGIWAFVSFGDGPTETAETGWVRSKFLSSPLVADSR